jgi:hypothetical protein
MERGQVIELLRPHPGTGRVVGEQVNERLDVVMRDSVRRQRMMFVAVGGYGVVSRTGAPGFVRVVVGGRGLDWPEPPDAPVAASGRLSVLFVDFFRDHLALRVDGRAMILDGRARMRVERAILRRT